MSNIIHDTPTDHGLEAPAGGDELARQQAVRQIERRRRFWVSVAWSAIATVILVFIWAVSEYHNAGGWPVHGLSQSSGIHEVWNFWIVYPVGALVLLLAAHAWFVYGNKPISEDQIKREMERQAGSPRLSRRSHSSKVANIAAMASSTARMKPSHCEGVCTPKNATHRPPQG